MQTPLARESSPLSMPQVSDSDSASEAQAPSDNVAEGLAPVSDKPSEVTTSRVPRMAARRAQAALKRVFEDSSADEQPTKRVRPATSSVPPTADVADVAETPSSDLLLDGPQLSQPTPVAQERMQTIIESMADDATATGTALQASAAKAPTQRPPPSGKPLVWANGRGALCEALPYFRSHKSSLHTQAVVAQGFLIDSEVEVGDYFGAQVIISSV